jgi:glycyl-tRNA synthetase beta chain
MNTNELILELFSEEIPAKMQVKAANQMLETLEKELKNLQINYNTAQYFVTPRRITLYITGIANELSEKTINKKGPKIEAKPEAIEGFLKSVNMQLNELSIIDGFYYANKLESAKPVDSLLTGILEQMLLSFTWPKSMRSGNSRSRWVRPLRNILCIFAGKILPLEFAGLKSNDFTYGHRFMAPNQLKIKSFADYKEKMHQAYVILSSEERKEIIINQTSAIAKKLDLKPILEPDLLTEVTGLVEYPNILIGKIDTQFLDLPKEVLVTAMKTHQRYFYLEDQQGKIAPYFLFVANIKNENDDLIINGNEKVLRARLADAKFFWEKDLKQPTSHNLAQLARMIFHHKLGNMFDKTNRIISLAEFITTKIGTIDINLSKKAALLAKTDLVSEMVGEFPELQGIIGKYYAEKSGEEKEVALAIAEHYRPIDANDIGNTSTLGAIIAIADKLDSITGLWIAGEKPTSSKDPFALRRAALGIIKLIRYHKFDLSLTELLYKSLKCYGFSYSEQEEIFNFFKDRLKYHFKAENFRHDLIMATIEQESDNINSLSSKLTELSNFIQNPNAEEVLFSIKRILSILTENKANLTLAVEEELLLPIEKTLYQETLLKKATLADLSSLSPIINQFFAEVMVNDPDPKLKQNRLNLLYNIANLSYQIADFSQIKTL